MLVHVYVYIFFNNGDFIKLIKHVLTAFSFIINYTKLNFFELLQKTIKFSI